MLEKLYALSENGGEEAKTVMDFLARFVKDDATEELFLAAVHDARFAGYREGVKAAMMLFAEAQA